MNERIKELAVQARQEFLKLPTGYTAEQIGMYPQLMERFAELIVQDIFNVMNDQKTYNRCTYTTHDLDKAKCVVHEVIKCVNEHFGTKL